MAGTLTSHHTIHVHRFHSRYRVAADFPDPEGLRRRLDESVVSVLQQALESDLVGLQNNDAIILIRRLELDLIVNVGMEPPQLARSWAREILRELRIALQTERAAGLVHFTDRSAYLASFLSDLIRGEAWSKWYYRRFDGLRMLPLSAAIRTLLCDVENDSREILFKLDPVMQDRLLGVLSSQDALRILQHLCRRPGEENPDILLSVISHCVEESPQLLQGDEAEANMELRLYLAVTQLAPALSGPGMSALLFAAMHLLRHLFHCDVVEGERLLHLLLQGDSIRLYRHYPLQAERWIPLMQVQVDTLEALGHMVLRQSGEIPRPSRSSAQSQAPAHTRFGGVFLLLPLLDGLPLQTMTEHWPAPDAGDSAGLLRLLLIMKALGQPQAGALFFDPLVRESLDIPPSVTPATLRKWQRTLSIRHLNLALYHYREWQQRMAIVGDESALLTSVSAEGGQVALMLDGAGGWLHLSGYRRDRLEPLYKRISGGVVASTKRLLVDPVFSSLLEQFRQELNLLTDVDESVVQADRGQGPVAEMLARIDRLPGELAYIALPKSFRGRRSTELIFSLMAQGLLRGLSRRLPGFSLASLPYLFTNFLDFNASVEPESQRWVVRLTQPPLHLILNMTGVTRDRYRLSWLPDLELELYQTG